MSYTNYEELIGINIRSAREEQGLSQIELERRSGISSTTISSYENKHKTPGLNTIVRIAEALNVSLDRLVYGDESEAIINKGGSKGRKIVNCAEFLIQNGVLARDAVVVEKNKIKEFITIKDYRSQMERLYKFMEEYKAKRSTYSNPEGYLEQTLESIANEIDTMDEMKENMKAMASYRVNG